MKWTFVAFLGLVFSVFVYFEINEIPIYNLKVAYKFITGVSDYEQYEGLAEKLGYSESDKLLINGSGEIFLQNKILSPKYLKIKSQFSQTELKKIKKKLKFPVVIKPLNEGSSLGVYICNKNNFVKTKLF